MTNPGFGLTGGAKTESKHLAQHLHTPRSSSDTGGAATETALKSPWRAMETAEYTVHTNIRCRFIRQYKSLCSNKAKHQG